MRTRLVPAGIVFAVFVALHGVAHFAGVAGETGVRSLLWAVVGVVMIAAGVLVAVRAPQARVAVAVAATASLVLSVVSLWAAVVGVFVNLAVLLVVRRNPRSVFGRVEGIDLAAVDRFLAGHRVAVVGASTDRRKFGNTVFRELRDHGYDVVPVNPSATEVEGAPCYAGLADVPGVLDGVMVMVGGDAAVDAVHACAARRVRSVWLFRGLGGPGALSAASLAACAEHRLDVVAGACPLMFLAPVARVHDVHRAFRRFNGAFTHAARTSPRWRRSSAAGRNRPRPATTPGG